MNRLPYATAMISVTVAVALWLLATWLESDSPWLATGPTEVTRIAAEPVRPDTPLQSSGSAAACERAEEALRAKVDDSQYCVSDEDCTLFDYGYPIQCLTSVAKDEITSLRLEYRNYEQSCTHRVYYDCPTGEMKRRAVCRDNRCAVELQSNEILEEETRDYLGLEPR